VAVHAFNFLVAHLRKTCGTSSGTSVDYLFLIAVGAYNGYWNVACRLGFHTYSPIFTQVAGADA
jgi:hypothetical protein